MTKVLVTNKDGYKIYAQVHPATKRLHNFSVEGLGARPHVTYTFINEAESLISHLTKKQTK